MKKLPEEDLWNRLKSRLGDYREDPDEDTWEKISGALPKAPTSNRLTRNQMIASLLLLLVASLGWGVYEYTVEISQEAKGSQATIYSPKAIDPSGTNVQQNSSAYNESDAAKDEVDDSEGVRMADSSSTIDAAHDPSESSTHDASSSTTRSAKLKNDVRDLSRDEQGSNTAQATNHQEPKKIRINGSGADATQRNKDHNNSAHQNNGMAAGQADTNFQSKNKTSTSGINEDEVVSGGTHALSTKNLSADDQQNVTPDTSLLSVNPDGRRSDNNDFDKEKRKSNGVQASAITDSATLIPEAIPETISGETKHAAKESKEPDTKKRQATNRRFYFAITPSLAFVIIGPEPNDAVNVVGLRSPGIFNKDRFGLSVDAGMERSISKRMEWYAGLSFYQQNQRIAYEYEIPGTLVEGDGTRGYSLSPATAAKEFNYKMFNAGVSTGLFYKIMGVKILHKMGIGVHFQQGISKAGPEMAYDNSSSQYLNYQLSYRIQFPMEGNYTLYFQPTFIHSILTNEKLSEPFSVKPYRAGITLGISFKNLSRNSR